MRPSLLFILLTFYNLAFSQSSEIAQQGKDEKEKATIIACGPWNPMPPQEPYNIYQIDSLPYFKHKPLRSNDPEELQLQIKEFITTNFDTSIFNSTKFYGRQRIIVRFVIEKTGEVSQIQIRAQYDEIEHYTLEIINCLPKFVPGKLKNEAVSVIYPLPILFNPEPN
ncbi:energy transducer TonB [Aureisphaera galaxeae]|uniref:energy transducer TonB n=1 Tax=Aureisphaera galaxeae TaxID=1538023 RepID=UPI0023505E96|nr:energy transducer TonB [Aureisphaera galaxeae]MDC8005943.1 energy transducer TonB [Aureisphaera galaxeae]